MDFDTLPFLSLTLVGLVGLAGLILMGISLKPLFSGKQPAAPGGSPRNELERLLTDIGHGLRTLSSPTRAGGFFYLEKQEEVSWMIGELERRLRFLDDESRQALEARAEQVLVQAAIAGIIPPSPASPPGTGHPRS